MNRILANDTMEKSHFRLSALEPWQRTLYIMFVAQLMVAVGFSSIFPFLPLYVEELGSSTGISVEILAGLVYSGQAFAMIFSAPVWGTLADRYGRKLMVVRSMFGGCIILLLMAFVTSAEQLVGLRMLQGLVTGTIAAANALVASMAPRKSMGYAMGLLQVGFGTGIAVGPLIGGAIADAFDYSSAFYVTAVMLFLAGILVTLGVKENFVPRGQRGPRQNFLKQWRHILAPRGVQISYLLRFFSSLARTIIVPIVPLLIPTLLVDQSALNTFTGLVQGLGSAAATISAIYLGRLGDRIGHRKVVIGSVFVSAVLYLPQSLVTAGWQLLVLQILVGVAVGGIIPSISALLAQFIQQAETGAAYGLDNSINAAGRALAPLIGGAVAAWTNLRVTFVVTSVLFFVTGLMALWLVPRKENIPVTASAD